MRLLPQRLRGRLLIADFVVAVAAIGAAVLPAEQRDQAFERFYRLDAARSRYEGGAGIGVSVVRALAEAMDGRAWAESDGPGRGSTFVVSLPAAAPS